MARRGAGRSCQTPGQTQLPTDETGLSVSVGHFPPGTSKWNRIEHRLFSFISSNWRGQPLLSPANFVNLIGATKTAGGLKVPCRLDTNTYPSGVKVTNEPMAMIRLKPGSFHGEWNYTIQPRTKSA